MSNARPAVGRVARVALVVLLGTSGCRSAESTATSTRSASSGEETLSTSPTSATVDPADFGASTTNTSCLTDADRAAIDVSAPTAERFEEAFDAVDVPADAAGLHPLTRAAAALRALVLFDSIERDSSDPSEARLSAMLAIEVLGTLTTSRPACATEACARMGPLLLRHCPVELPDDDPTAACPTLALYAQRCVAVVP